ncbi:tryptophan-rich sensory protein [Rothia amarae]|uniref:tryptophan-rich sensory protein n=1 Tax=Rothia amarae TaxID=169480 RepID=UPI001EE3F6C0|nr:tryptophan-rich sensory protein [Rothia amarae]
MKDGKDRVALVTGSTGYIGGQLIIELLKNGWAVKALSRDRAKAEHQSWGKHIVPEGSTAHSGQVEVIEGDLEDKEALDRACAGVNVAWYLVHSMSEGSDFRAQDKKMVEKFVESAKPAGIERVVYLSGLHPENGELSEHLASRVEVGDILLNSGIPTAVLQAGIVIGDGSESFSMLRHTAERLPGIVGPGWMRNKVTPVGIKDALFYLRKAADFPADINRTFDIGARETVPYIEMIRRYSEIALKVPRVIFIAPVITQNLAATWISLITPLKKKMALPLIQSLEHNTVVKERDIIELAGEPEGGISSFEDAVKHALRTVDTGLWARTAWGTTGAVVATAIVGSLLTDPENRWYKNLKKPSWQPPALAFPIVWTALYADIAAISSLVLADAQEKARAGEQDGTKEAKSYAVALGANLVLNATWSGLFFRSRRPWLAAVESVALAASSIDLARRAGQSSAERGVALAPYGAWTSFAVVLNSVIAYLNRDSRTPLQKVVDRGLVAGQRSADLAQEGCNSLGKGAKFALRKGVGLALRSFPPYVVASRGLKIYRTAQRGRKTFKKWM